MDGLHKYPNMFLDRNKNCRSLYRENDEKKRILIQMKLMTLVSLIKENVRELSTELNLSRTLLANLILYNIYLITFNSNVINLHLKIKHMYNKILCKCSHLT